MKSLINALLVAVACYSVPARANVTIISTSVGCEKGATSTGGVIDADFRFALGTFSQAPTLSTMSLWKDDFTALATGVWVNDIDDTGIVGTGHYTINFGGMYSGGIAAGQHVYVWGYNTANTEWILLTNASWTLPTDNAFPSNFWTPSTYEAGTYAIVGSLSPISAGEDIYIQTMAVPEPTSVVSIGLGVLTLVVVRRRILASSYDMTRPRNKSV